MPSEEMEIISIVFAYMMIIADPGK
jgi:hypothetical protein